LLKLAWLWVLALMPLPLLIRWLFPPQRNTVGRALRVPFFVDHQDAPNQSSEARLGLAALAILGWLSLLLAAARPQWVGEPLPLPLNGRDLMLAVDISGSMETADMVIGSQAVNRLVAVKAVAGEFIERRQGDRIGLILFGRRAYLQTPLTFDRATARILLDESAIGLAGKETAIGDAIGLAVKRLREQPEENRVLILLTDGANTSGEVEPLKAAELAAQEKLKIYTIGVGADEMMVRSLFGERRVNPSADLDEETLTRIAELTGGRYFRARDTEELLQIYAILDELEPVAEENQWLRPPKELYIWPLMLSIGFVVLTIVMMRLRPRGVSA